MLYFATDWRNSLKIKIKQFSQLHFMAREELHWGSLSLSLGATFSPERKSRRSLLMISGTLYRKGRKARCACKFTNHRAFERC